VSNHRKLRLRWLLSHGGTDQLCPQVTINDLPDEGLLEIFGFYRAYPYPLPPLSYEEHAWHTLVHVCRRWRYVVFGSPRRLNLRLLCMNLSGTLTKTLDIWPELPIIMHVTYGKMIQPPSVTDVISVLKRHDRVCKITTHNIPNSLLKEVAAMSEPFPVLIDLELVSFEEDPPIVPDSFLGGSVPSLQSLNLSGIPFPAIGKLLLSTRRLDTLYLGSIPPSGYISPEAMVAILSPLTRLKSLYLSFFKFLQFWTHGAGQHSPALTRVVLPALTTFHYSGNREYLEDMVSRIDAPLDSIDVTLFDQPVFDIPLLRDFIGRTKILNSPHQVDISFSLSNARISLFQRKGDIDFKVLALVIFHSTPGLPLSSLVQSCSSFLPPLPSLEHLGVYKSEYLPSRGQDGVESTQWLELLCPFITVKDLVLDEPTALSVASALQELVEERVTDILPALQNIFLEGFQLSGTVPEGIGKFIAARELSGRPVIVHHRETKQELY